MEPSETGSNCECGNGEAPCSAESRTETVACGPGCACGTPSGGRNVKVVISLIAVLAVAGILVYKLSIARDGASNNIDPKSNPAFAFAQPAQPSPTVAPGTESQSIMFAGQTSTTAPAGQRIGDNLESLSALNEVAASQDAVFVFVPALKNELADAKTTAALLAAQRTLQSNKVKLGLYTLSTSSSDYAAVSAGVQVPAILVASKGKGMAAVSGEMSEDKLLQAFTASSRAGGCGPSGCGPSSPACE